MNRSWLGATGAALVVAVIAAIVAALIVSGSPGVARKERADVERSNRLNAMVESVRNFRGAEKRLPESFDEVVAKALASNDLAKDPVTNMPLEYKKIDEAQFEVCAVFETDTLKDERPVYATYGPDLQRHPKGRHCFALPAKRP